jgi:hypothetical protein
MERLYQKLKHPTKGLQLAISISVALSLWLVLKLNLKYETTLLFPCRIVQIPENTNIHTSVLSPISFVVEGKGTRLLRHYFSFTPDTLLLRYERNFSKGYIVINQYIKQLEANDELKDLRVQYIKQDTFFLSPPNQKTKKVPIVLKGNAQLSPECRFSAAPKLQPDSVTLIGNEQTISYFKEWETEGFETPPLREFTDQNIHLRQVSGIKTFPKDIKVRFFATAYTQININIALNVKDLPHDVKLKWDNPNLEAIIMLPLSQYEAIQKESYSLKFSFADLQAGKVLVPDFSFLPPEVKVVDYAPKNIKYVIVKNN